MVEAGPRILPELDPTLAAYAAERLRERGIELRTSTRLERLERRGGAPVGRRGAPGRDGRVDRGRAGVAARDRPSACRSTSGSHQRSTARSGSRGCAGCGRQGTCAAVPDRARVSTGTSPPTAQHALRQARVLAENVAATLEGGTLRSRSATRTRGCCARSVTTGAWRTHSGCGSRASLRGSCTARTTCCTCRRGRARRGSRWTGPSRLLFPRDIAQLGSLEHPRDAFRRAAGE